MTNENAADLHDNWMCSSLLKGNTAIIVGAGSGMGESTARRYAANGGQILVTDINADEARRVADDIVAAGGDAISAKLDISSQADIDAGIAQVVGHFGKLDTVINTSALVIPDALENVKIDEWRKCFAVNVDGPLLLARSALPHLEKSAVASIVNVTSLAGIHGYSGGGPYGPSKAALIVLTHQMANEWAPLGIRVNAVTPGTVLTPMAKATVRPEVREHRRKSIPMQRLGEPREVADVILFLVSPAASFVTGQVVNIDGGFSHAMFMHRLGQNHDSMER